jgi:phosphohistidine swiveling domain-containing protein
MGIPTIVGILGLTSTLQTGQVVTMDGAAGTVKTNIAGGNTAP